MEIKKLLNGEVTDDEDSLEYVQMVGFPRILRLFGEWENMLRNGQKRNSWIDLGYQNLYSAEF